MNDPIVDKIAQTLCFASRVHQDSMYCPMCDEQGRCQSEMWTGFRPEAAAVAGMLKKSGLLVTAPTIKPMLPGLGGTSQLRKS